MADTLAYLVPPLVLGLIGGFLGGYAGIAGAPLLIALMVILLGWEQHAAQGTILAVMLGPMTLFGLLVMRHRLWPLRYYILAGVLAYMVASYAGAWAAFRVPDLPLRLTFMALLFGLGVRNLLVRPAAVGRPLNPHGLTVTHPRLAPRPVWVILVCIVVGVIGGFWGIGAGVLMVPLFMGLFGAHKDDARTLSLAILLPPVSLGAAVVYHQQGAIRWDIAGIIFLGYMATNYFGARLGRWHDHATFSRWFGLVMLLLGLSHLALVLWGGR